MVNQDILEGLKSALFKGETVNKAMISFYNAGYKKEEIEEAARILQTQPAIQPIIPTIPKGEKQEDKIVQPATSQIPQNQVQPQQPKQDQKETKEEPLNKQRVSGYGKKKKGKALIIVLGIFLFLLVGILTVVFLFKDQLIEILNNML